jgi:hypothetical protein
VRLKPAPIRASKTNHEEQKINCSGFVTRKKGAYVSDQGEFIQYPSLHVVDLGLVMPFRVTSVAVQNVSVEVLGFIGNAMGSLAVEILGNKKPVDKPSIQKYLTSLLK